MIFFRVNKLYSFNC